MLHRLRQLCARFRQPSSSAAERAADHDGDALRAAYHVDDSFREPRQAEQLQRLLTLHAQREQERDAERRSAERS